MAHVPFGGKYAGNTFRDLERRLGHTPLHQSLHKFRIPMKSELYSLVTTEREQQMILPHVVFATLCEDRPDDFRRLMLGPPGATQKFWDDMVFRYQGPSR